jgi:hypothetical protein
LGHQRPHTAVEIGHRIGSGSALGGPQNYYCAAASLQIEPSFVSQNPVGFGDRVEVDAEIEGDLARRRQAIAGGDCAMRGFTC